MNTPITHARFLDIHILQTLPYSNVNRDDLGSPKTVTFGGTTRTRVSSQAWKRPTRKAVEESIGEKALRTRRLPLQVSTLLAEERNWPADLAQFAGTQVVISTDSKLALDKERDKADQATASLLFLPMDAVGRLAGIAEQHRTALEKALGTKAANKPVLPKDEVHEVLRSRNGSIALFGRMLAEIPGAGVDGAVQVAHAFTTHSTSVQGDFFTAVDDVDQWAQDAGSAHMNTAEFSSGVFYRYATIDLRDLASSVADPATARELATAFVSSFISSVPSAKKTSTAPHTIPDLVHVSVRADRPVSYAAAFEKPVSPGAGGWAGPSRTALSTYAQKVCVLLGTDALMHRAYAGIDSGALDGLGVRTESFPELVADAVDAAMKTEAATA
ncbi:type I-E CRISPR-associated protein Cas7/Cse4/CasC [Streptomyces sp. NPDC047967]|uniref:type I-E CRISPR-associated protein Cas7/Cse4/CasC n=1 Tax=Streptomyces sp. NPDC047967 TaxID=3154924 RepID=UPI003405650F